MPPGSRRPRPGRAEVGRPATLSESRLRSRPPNRSLRPWRFAAEPLSLSEPLDRMAMLLAMSSRTARPKSPFEVAVTASPPEEISRLLLVDERQRKSEASLRSHRERRDLEEVVSTSTSPGKRIDRSRRGPCPKLRHPVQRYGVRPPRSLPHRRVSSMTRSHSDPGGVKRSRPTALAKRRLSQADERCRSDLVVPMVIDLMFNTVLPCERQGAATRPVSGCCRRREAICLCFVLVRGIVMIRKRSTTSSGGRRSSWRDRARTGDRTNDVPLSIGTLAALRAEPGTCSIRR